MRVIEEKPRAEIVEMMIDAMGLHDFLDMVSQVADDKADHLESNWQDRPAATKWRRAAKRLSTIATWCRKVGPA
jgi:hypothetical protein